jgi:hypothetical protein
MTNEKVEELWLGREQQMLGELNGRIRFFIIWALFNQISQRFLSNVVLVCAVLAPVIVTSGEGTGLGVFFSDPSSSLFKKLSLGITLTLALAEGLRRTFQFDHRWAVCANCRERLLSLRDAYLDQQVGKAAGSEDWVTNLFNTRRQFEEVVMEHIKDFAQMLRGVGRDGRARSAKQI